jgi:hypothetical protein
VNFIGHRVDAVMFRRRLSGASRHRCALRESVDRGVGRRRASSQIAPAHLQAAVCVCDLLTGEPAHAPATAFVLV